ncbi:hypothetical protein B0H10DRAFT_2188032 [Mycena sp. CBHHK59/15]|nr:hypothetical protein B0H10DRAFT_2188032 [Mycena sp. CBHHK59/15]
MRAIQPFFRILRLLCSALQHGLCRGDAAARSVAPDFLFKIWTSRSQPLNLASISRRWRAVWPSNFNPRFRLPMSNTFLPWPPSTPLLATSPRNSRRLPRKTSTLWGKKKWEPDNILTSNLKASACWCDTLGAGPEMSSNARIFPSFEQVCTFSGSFVQILNLACEVKLPVPSPIADAFAVTLRLSWASRDRCSTQIGLDGQAGWDGARWDLVHEHSDVDQRGKTDTASMRGSTGTCPSGAHTNARGRHSAQAGHACVMSVLSARFGIAPPMEDLNRGVAATFRAMMMSARLNDVVVIFAAKHPMLTFMHICLGMAWATSGASSWSAAPPRQVGPRSQAATCCGAPGQQQPAARAEPATGVRQHPAPRAAAPAAGVPGQHVAGARGEHATKGAGAGAPSCERRWAGDVCGDGIFAEMGFTGTKAEDKDRMATKPFQIAYGLTQILPNLDCMIGFG